VYLFFNDAVDNVICLLFEEVRLVDVPFGVGQDIRDFRDYFGVFRFRGFALPIKAKERRIGFHKRLQR